MNSSKMVNPNGDLSILISVSKSPKEVYDAINNVPAWWTGDVSGSAEKVGDEFSYKYKEFHSSTQKVTELIPYKKIVWHVEDAVLGFAKNKNEWKGTDIVFEISAGGEQTNVKFTHYGLTPEVECFEACSGGWKFYLTKSLKSLLTNGCGLDPGY
jgi:hypothetical protein